MYVRFPLSLRNVEDLLFDHGINVSHKTLRSCQTTKNLVRQVTVTPKKRCRA